MQGVEGGEGNGAVANPGLAYGGAYKAAEGGALGASALSPSAGSCAGAAGTTQPGTGHQPVLSHPGKDADTTQDGDSDGIENGLALPFVPVALVFKDVHYYVKHREGSGELQLLKASVSTFPLCVSYLNPHAGPVCLCVSMRTFACCNPVYSFAKCVIVNFSCVQLSCIPC